METFDLTLYQKQAREAFSPKRLFELWEQVCRFYEKGQIGKHELRQMKAVVWPKIRRLNSLQNLVNDSFGVSAVLP